VAQGIVVFIIRKLMRKRSDYDSKEFYILLGVVAGIMLALAIGTLVLYFPWLHSLCL